MITGGHETGRAGRGHERKTGPACQRHGSPVRGTAAAGIVTAAAVVVTAAAVTAVVLTAFTAFTSA
ncbi:MULTISPECIES: hypothetical protein [unclassified Streptosporangium]|uniref:hypothetical protein n=1 Tax=unclassified Streptosporangium TaxID=2632669 RepID=UPI002E2A6291|nr:MULTISPECIES: hypothetical protein [unclassified Streptosporangium]